MKPPFKGNKSNLPSKLCERCERVMTWRKSWAKNWEQVKYCSQSCRDGKPRSTARAF
nr:DUF2256 domain-containing protein [Limnohabitans sp. Rim8]